MAKTSKQLLFFTGAFLVALLLALLCFLSGCTSDEHAAEKPQSRTTASVSHSLTVSFLDVGQGDATLLECDGHWMLIDGGPSSASSKMYAVLQACGVKKLDAIIATHPDSDHIGGLSGALHYCPADQLFCSTDNYDSDPFRDMLRAFETSGGARITVPSAYESFQLGDATVRFLSNTHTETVNDASLCVLIEHGSCSYLFTGDIGSEAERDLAETNDIKADVLHVGHHGSAHSSDSVFLDSVCASYAVISVGENDYGHPTGEAINRLESSGAQVLRTDELGDISISSNGRTLSVATGSEALPQLVPSSSSTDSTANSDDTAEYRYVLNSNTMKIHLPACRAVEKIADHNRINWKGTYEEAVNEGYSPCAICNPQRQ